MGGWKLSPMGEPRREHRAATGRRVVCLSKGRISNNVDQIPYRGIETVSETGLEEFRITGPRLDFGIRSTFEIRLLACAAGSLLQTLSMRAC